MIYTVENEAPVGKLPVGELPTEYVMEMRDSIVKKIIDAGDTPASYYLTVTVDNGIATMVARVRKFAGCHLPKWTIPAVARGK